MRNLYEKLVEYGQSDYYGFHMPGHKRRDLIANQAGAFKLPYGLDITEIDGFDDLHHAKDLLKQAQDRAALLYNAGQTYYLINGSTSGLIAAILGCTRKGEKILMARNCHKSVYNAVFMNELRPTYLYPKVYAETELNGPIEAADVRHALEREREIKAVVITSPTYDGVVSNVKAIAEVVHAYHIPLIVDEAHGAHFGFHKFFPENSNVLGADIVIHSLHKTLPSLTQTALLHMNGKRVNRERVQSYLHMLQTSSPSYVLMASMDVCVDLLENHSEKLFEQYVEILKSTRHSLQAMKRLKLWQTDDPSKLVFSVQNTKLESRQLYEILLEKYHLQMEMTAGSYVLAMTSVADSKEGMKRLVDALHEIDRKLDEARQSDVTAQQSLWQLPYLEQRYSSAEAEQAKDLFYEIESGHIQEKQVKNLPWDKCIGSVSLEYAYVYPPGIPLVVPGEVISKEVVDMLNQYKKIGFSIEGLEIEGNMEVLIDG